MIINRQSFGQKSSNKPECFSEMLGDYCFQYFYLGLILFLSIFQILGLKQGCIPVGV